jgi:hypothetical protein
MKRLDFKSRLKEALPGVNIHCIIHRCGVLQVYLKGNFAPISIPEVTKTTWTKANLQAIIEVMPSNRCATCGRFVSLDVYEGEEFNYYPSVDEAGNISAEFRLILICAECGEEMNEAPVEFSIDPTAEMEEHMHTQHPTRWVAGDLVDDCLPEFEVECTNVTVYNHEKSYVVELKLHVTCAVHWTWEGCTIIATAEIQAEDLN